MHKRSTEIVAADTMVSRVRMISTRWPAHRFRLGHKAGKLWLLVNAARARCILTQAH